MIMKEFVLVPTHEFEKLKQESSCAESLKKPENASQKHEQDQIMESNISNEITNKLLEKLIRKHTDQDVRSNPDSLPKNHIPIYVNSAPIAFRQQGRDLLNELVDKRIIEISNEGTVTLIESGDKISLEDLLRSIYIKNATVKAFTDFLKKIIKHLDVEKIRNPKLKQLIGIGGSKIPPDWIRIN